MYVSRQPQTPWPRCPPTPPRDRLLDFAIGLRDSIRGKTEGAHLVEDVNRALVETFGAFVIWDHHLPAESSETFVIWEPSPRSEFEYGPAVPTMPAVFDALGDDAGPHQDRPGSPTGGRGGAAARGGLARPRLRRPSRAAARVD